MNGTNKLECYNTLGFKGMPDTNTLAYWDHCTELYNKKGVIPEIRTNVLYPCKLLARIFSDILNGSSSRLARFFSRKPPVTAALLTLVTLGTLTQSGLLLFVLCSPRWPRQVIQCHCKGSWTLAMILRQKSQWQWHMTIDTYACDSHYCTCLGHFEWCDKK